MTEEDEEGAERRWSLRQRATCVDTRPRRTHARDRPLITVHAPRARLSLTLASTSQPSQ